MDARFGHQGALQEGKADLLGKGAVGENSSAQRYFCRQMAYFWQKSCGKRV